ncbi:MAG: single-stranded DNA-binding protein [Myxococcota bacterium]
MGSLNKVILIGNLGGDPELRQTTNGTPVANMSIATSEQWTDGNGQRQQRTEWHRIVVWGKSAEACAGYLSKGRTVSVEGRMQTRDWTDQNGTTRYATEVVASNVVFLGGGQQQSQARQQTDNGVQAGGGYGQPSANSDGPNYDDIPF